MHHAKRVRQKRAVPVGTSFKYNLVNTSHALRTAFPNTVAARFVVLAVGNKSRDSLDVPIIATQVITARDEYRYHVFVVDDLVSDIKYEICGRYSYEELILCCNPLARKACLEGFDLDSIIDQLVPREEVEDDTKYETLERRLIKQYFKKRIQLKVKDLQ